MSNIVINPLSEISSVNNEIHVNVNIIHVLNII